MTEEKHLRVLFITSQWPTSENPSLAPFVKREVEGLRKAGVDIDVFVYAGGWKPLKYLRAIWQMHQMLRKTPYDLIHVRFGQCGIVARAQYRVPVVITFGGSDIQATPPPKASIITKLQYMILRLTSNLIARSVDEVIVVSDHLGKLLPRQNYHVIASGLDLSLFKPMDQIEARKQLGFPLGKKLVLFAGNPAKPIKRFDLAKAVFELAKHSLPDIELIVLHGYSPDQVPIFMNACDVLLLTSTNEGSPNVIKEALACKLSIVTVNVGDVQERIADVDGCIVCEDDYPQTLANALVSQLSIKTRLGDVDLHELDIRNTSQKVVDVYRKMLSICATYD